MARNLVILGVLAFSITLAIIVGERLSNESLAVVVGTVCGVAASLPVSLTVILLAQRFRANEPPRPRPEDRPPVVVIQSGPAQWSPPYPNTPALPWYPPAANAPRKFEVIGEPGEE